MKSILKAFLPIWLYNALKSFYIRFEKKPVVHLDNVFGFDIYQNVNDIIDYSKFQGVKLESLPNTVDSRVFETMKKYIRPGSIAIDVGANIGLMSLAMHSLVGNSGHVYSFEPGPVSFGLLRRNVFTNCLSGCVSIYDCALSDSIGVFNFFINPNGESDNQLHKNETSYVFRNERARQKISVQTTTLDNFIKCNNIASDLVSFIKIDTQGHDLSVILGGWNFFKNAERVAVLVEFAPYLKAWEMQSIEYFYKKVVELGFDIYDESNLNLGPVDLDYLSNNYGFHKHGIYTDLLLLKCKKMIQ